VCRVDQSVESLSKEAVHVFQFVYCGNGNKCCHYGNQWVL
jgi:hypothetical protein